MVSCSGGWPGRLLVLGRVPPIRGAARLHSGAWKRPAVKAQLPGGFCDGAPGSGAALLPAPQPLGPRVAGRRRAGIAEARPSGGPRGQTGKHESLSLRPEPMAVQVPRRENAQHGHVAPR